MVSSVCWHPRAMNHIMTLHDEKINCIRPNPFFKNNWLEFEQHHIGFFNAHMFHPMLIYWCKRHAVWLFLSTSKYFCADKSFFPFILGVNKSDTLYLENASIHELQAQFEAYYRIITIGFEQIIVVMNANDILIKGVIEPKCRFPNFSNLDVEYMFI